MGKAAAQIVTSFGNDELYIHDAVKEIHARSGIPVSVIVKTALRATLFKDQDSLDSLQAYRHFSKAPLPGRAVNPASA